MLGMYVESLTMLEEDVDLLILCPNVKVDN